MLEKFVENKQSMATILKEAKKLKTGREKISDINLYLKERERAKGEIRKVTWIYSKS